MEERKIEKIATLLTTGIVMYLTLQDINNWQNVGIYSGCSLQNRFLYSFFHANILHAVLNAWCLISIVFIYDITIWRMLLAFLVAASIPIDSMGTIIPGLGVPTVGLSGVVFFLFGSISFEVLRKWYYQLWMMFYILIGFIFPSTNAWLHLYCYASGLFFALLNKPIILGNNEQSDKQHIGRK